VNWVRFRARDWAAEGFRHRQVNGQLLIKAIVLFIISRLNMLHYEAPQENGTLFSGHGAVYMKQEGSQAGSRDSIVGKMYAK